MIGMTTRPANYRLSIILWSLPWALALIASAYFFRDSAAGYWIDAALLAGSIFSLMWNHERVARSR